MECLVDEAASCNAERGRVGGACAHADLQTSKSWLIVGMVRFLMVSIVFVSAVDAHVRGRNALNIVGEPADVR